MMDRKGWTMRAWVLFAAVGTSLLLACSGSGSTNTTSSGSGPGSGVTLTNNGCSLTLSGSYTFTYTQMTGDCGMLQPVHETVQGMAQANSQTLSMACQGGSGNEVAQPSASGCSLTGNLSGCQIPNSGESFDMSEQVIWNPSYTSATGTFSISVMGTSACSGTYTLNVTQP
jgi:hypothetical protein